MAYSLEPLRGGGDPPLPQELGRAIEPHRFPATLGGSIHHGFDRGRAFAAGTDAHELVGEGNLAGLVAKVIFLLDQPDPFDVKAILKRRNRAALLGGVPLRTHRVSFGARPLG